ncbi:MAG: amidoligase family protein [Bdellovibrionales bacterium]|nr:amidoligase family protein [Bdellovibrionales bacterium]
MFMNFFLPSRIKNEHGETRMVGFEMEFGGLDLEETAQILIDLFGGSVIRVNPYIYKVPTHLGEFQLEADSNFLKERKFERYFKALGLDPTDSVLAGGVEEALASLAGTLIPFEVVMPPMPINRLEPVDQVRAALQAHSAKGSRTALFMALGMQFNPEVPDKEPETLLSYLRAFFLLYDWLFVESDVTLTRRVAPYIHRFPNEYVDMVLNPSYRPDLDELMTDYLTMNPTRNRPLDMLPLFAHINPHKVFSYAVERDLVKSRPTFHYRLPNSQVDDPEWSVAADWNKWVEIERLACDPLRMREMSHDYIHVHEDTLLFTRNKWVEKTRDWLHV